MISLDDGKAELAVVTDVTMGGTSLVDGELEIMVHRRCQADDHRGVQEPINETMCGCNDIHAKPGNMGANGHEGDGGCDCAGLTMRGSAYMILDTLQNAHKTRRQLIEQLNFAPTLAFTHAIPTNPSMTAIAAELPPNVKLQTITNNYAAWNDGKILLRLAHMYSVGEHETLSKPATFSLAAVFAKSGLKFLAAQETMLTANQPRATFEAKKLTWPTAAGGYENTDVEGVQTQRVLLDESDATMTVTLRAMEVKTYLVSIA
eukprot:SAG31_NODE_901_length_11133_cov_9.476799_7_plen_261_part_00